LRDLQENFGKAGAYYYWISRGVDDRPVRADRIRKSVGAENTFSSDLTEFDAMVAELQPLVDKVWRHCEGTSNRGRTVTLKVKFFDFESITRSRSVAAPVSNRDDLERLAVGLLQAEMPPNLFGCSGSRCHRCRPPSRRSRNSIFRCDPIAPTAIPLCVWDSGPRG
jgi:nucleotidyltransferase/DNA polymerase involved in DNA repair